jgi:branched-chain amino acid transport system substrate-binding protein
MSTARKSIVGLVLLILVLSTVAGCGAKEKETVKISFIGPLTGPHAAMGIGGRNSFMLAVKQRNEDPETKYHYEVVAIDDECQPDVGVQAALKACGDPEIIASASHYCSMVAITTADTFHNCGLSSTVWGAVLPDITYGNDYIEVCRANGTMVQQNQEHAKWAWEQGFRKISIMHDVTDYGRGHLEYFSEAWEALGGEILSVDGVLIDQTDFTAELTNIKALDPDMIYFGGLTDRGVAIKSQFDKLEMKCQFDGTSGIKNEAFNDALGEGAEGVISWLEGAPMEKLPGGAEFLAAYDEAGYEQPPEAYGPFAHVAGHLIIDAIEEVGPDRKKVAERINETEVEDTIIGPVEFDEYGQNIVPLVTCYVSQDGKWVVWEDSEYASGQRTLPGVKYMQEK